MALTTIDDRGLKTPIDLLDNEKIRLGTGNDIELYHDGSNSYIKDTGTGNLQIVSNQTNIQDADLSHYQAKFIDGGAVELYHSGTKKFETTSAGTQVSGNLVCGTVTLSGGGLALADDDKVICGTGDDLQIYHNGTNSYINNASGALAITGDDLNFENAARNETYAEMNNGGAVTLWYDNTKMLSTTSTGVSITGSGEVKALSATADNTDKKALFTTGHRDTSEENVSGLVIQGADGDNVVDIGGGQGSYNSATKVRFYTGANATTTTGTERMRINPTGTVIIGATSYSGGGATPAFYISNTSGRQAKIHNTNANTTSLQLTNASTGQGEDAGMMFATLGTSGDGWINNAENAAIRLGTNGTERLRILAGGGLTFNGDSASANALSDYEEGTWTPVIQGTGANNAKTYTIQLGKYTKIGNIVHCEFNIAWNSYSGNDSGNAIINGLPFTIDNNIATGAAIGAMACNNCNFSNGDQVTAAWEAANGQNYMYPLVTYDNGGWDNPAASGFFGANGNIRGQVTYRVN